jgi:ATP-dependent Clp protease adaptor protein ClpS
MSKADIKTRKTINIKYPDRFKIVILNDDYTPADFVSQLLIEIFNKPIAEAKKDYIASSRPRARSCRLLQW